MQKTLYLALVLAAAAFVMGFWATSKPSSIRNAAATSAGVSIDDMHRMIDMQSLPIQVPDPI
jgi:hypothetical protein